MLGHTLNAVMIQIITGIMTFIMLKLIEPLVPQGFRFIEIKRAIRTNLLEVYDCSKFSWCLLFKSTPS